MLCPGSYVSYFCLIEYAEMLVKSEHIHVAKMFVAIRLPLIISDTACLNFLSTFVDMMTLFRALRTQKNIQILLRQTSCVSLGDRNHHQL